MKHSIILSSSELQQSVIVKRIPIKPQPENIVADSKNRTPLAFFVNYKEWVKPPYQPGQVVYVREGWQNVFETEYDRNAEGYCVNIRTQIKNFDSIPKINVGLSTEDSCKRMAPRNKYYVFKDGNVEYTNKEYKLRWRSASTMPKEAARLWLKVLEVKAVFDGLWYWEVTMERTEAPI